MVGTLLDLLRIDEVEMDVISSVYGSLITLMIRVGKDI